MTLEIKYLHEAGIYTLFKLQQTKQKTQMSFNGWVTKNTQIHAKQLLSKCNKNSLLIKKKNNLGELPLNKAQWNAQLKVNGYLLYDSIHITHNDKMKDTENRLLAVSRQGMGTTKNSESIKEERGEPL